MNEARGEVCYHLSKKARGGQDQQINNTNNKKD